jgi:cobalt/nickel transport system permease protein
MAAILVGPWVSVVLASIALLLQAVFLAHGGLTTLGANIMTMGVAGSFAGYGAFVLCRKLGLSVLVAAFLGGVLSDWMTYSATSFILSAALHTGDSFWKMFLAIAFAFVPTQVPLGILEGFFTAGAYAWIQARRPQYVRMLEKGETA